MSTKSKQKRPDKGVNLNKMQPLVSEKGYTHQQAADSLGVSLSALYR